MADREHSSDTDEWKPIVALSRAMCEYADQGDWQEVTRLQGERHGLLTQVFSRRVSREESVAVAENIRQVLAADAEILALGSAARTNTSEALTLLRDRKKAHGAYTRTGKP